MLLGNCLGVKPNTRHIWQTVYSLCCSFSTKHRACPNFGPNWYIPQPGSWYKSKWCGTLHSRALANISEIVCCRPLFCTIHARRNVALAGTNYTSHVFWACCLFEGKLWATDGYLINKFPPDHTVFMLHASHSTSVLQSLMCFSQLSCFPLMWPKMTCGLSAETSSRWWIFFLF